MNAGTPCMSEERKEEEGQDAALTPGQAELLAAVESGNLDRVKELVAQDHSLVDSHPPSGAGRPGGAGGGWADEHPGRSLEPEGAWGRPTPRGPPFGLAQKDSAHAAPAEPPTPRRRLRAVELAAENVSWERPKHAQIARFLVEQGAWCDIHTAARAGLLEQVRKLLDENRALLDAEDGQGRTPLQRAALTPSECPECEAVADFLISRGAQVDLCTACAFGMTDVVKQRVAQNRRLVHVCCQGGTPLLWAVRPRRNPGAALEICKLLVESRSDLNAEDTALHHRTVLHHAAEWGNPLELIRFLVDRGADLNTRDDKGWTPLDYANERPPPRQACRR
ncbi:MAG: ankyrin repeat domain-containing protein [Planctomycetota bacterium]